MLHNLIARKIFLVGILLSVVFSASSVFASATNGTIDTTSKYAWGEDMGWINFGCDECDVAITDSAITGYAWSSNFGWINLNPTNAGVLNDAEGTLSGHAWSSNLGWINFTGVTINTEGVFLGYATVDSNSSQISFNCVNGLSCASSNFKVMTDWRPASSRPTVAGVSITGSGNVHRVPSVIYPPYIPPIIAPVITPAVNLTSNVFNYASDFISYLWNGTKTPPASVGVAEIPKIAPPALNGTWNLLPEPAINSFVFAPLPYEIRVLAAKFPELERTLKDVGIERFSDVSKLTGVSLNVPGLADILNTTIKTVSPQELAELEKLSGVTLTLPGISDVGGTLPKSVGTGKIALIQGLPIAKFSVSAKNNLPSEFVFARGAGELVDLNVALSVGDKGEVAQRISSLPGKTLKLVIKPISKARSVTGYVIFTSATPKITKNSILRSTLSASALFSMNGLVENVPANEIPVEKKLVLSSFEYTDPDNDGIYTADVVTPVVPGEYEIITVIDYIDPVLGSRRMSMVTVIDPEGYVFEKNNGKETRIPSAIVSLYKLNTSTKTYELWNAGDYSQDNPQITDVRGTYSFLVPEGSYYFHVEAPGYEPYEGKVFVVAEGAGVHQNIELSSGSAWLSELDWQTVLLIVVFLLLVYNPVVRLSKKLYYRI